MRHAFSFEPKAPTQGGSEEDNPDAVALEINGEIFECLDRTEVSGLDLLDYSAGMSFANPTSVRAATMTRWLELCVKDYPRFSKTMRTLSVDIEGVADISRTLAEAYSARPTQSSEQSSSGQPDDGSSSEADSS